MRTEIINNVNNIIVDVCKTMLSGCSDNVNITIHPKTIRYLTGVKIGDFVYRKGTRKDRNELKKRKVIDISNGCITVLVGSKRWVIDNTDVLELNENLREVVFLCKNPYLLKQRGNYKTCYQLAYNSPIGVVYCGVFSLCFITDRGYYSDWTEHNIYRLSSPEVANMEVKNNTIININ